MYIAGEFLSNYLLTDVFTIMLQRQGMTCESIERSRIASTRIM